MGVEHRRRTFDYVAVILATGVAVALNALVFALLYAAIARYHAGGDLSLSENGVQLLTGWGGGIIGVLGSYIGYVGGSKAHDNGQLEEAPPPPQ